MIGKKSLQCQYPNFLVILSFLVMLSFIVILSEVVASQSEAPRSRRTYAFSSHKQTAAIKTCYSKIQCFPAVLSVFSPSSLRASVYTRTTGSVPDNR